MTEYQASKKRETPILVWIVVGGIVAGSVNGVIFGSDNTPDWLLEYSRWIFGLIIAGFVLFGLALRGDLAALREAIHAAMDARGPGQRWRAAWDAWERGKK